MKRILLSIISTFALLNVLQAQQILINNPSPNVRNEIISIPYQQFTAHFNVDSIFSVKDRLGKVLPVQLEKLGGPDPVNVLIQIQINPTETIQLHVNKEKSPKFPSKTYARYVPERLDDFAWENDVLAFRIYGKALEGRKDDGQGIDYWSKRTPNLIIDKWYKINDYHKDHGEGMDYYAVGQTLGAGDMGIFLNNQLHYTKHYRTFKILDNGPLRTTFILNYENEIIEGQEVSFSKTISLDAGSNFNKIKINMHNHGKGKTPIAIGIAKRKEDKPLLIFNKAKGSLSYWEPEDKANGQSGIAVIIPKQKIELIDDRPEQALLSTEIKNSQVFQYYNGAAWNRAGIIMNGDAWEKAVSEFSTNLKKPLKVQLK